MIGGEEHREEDGRAPEPVAQRDIAGFEGVAIDDVVGDEGWEETEKSHDREQKMICEQTRKARRSARRIAECRGVLSRGLDKQDDEDHGVGIVDVEHDAGANAEEQPVQRGTTGPSLVPVPEKKRDDERRKGVRPGGIEIHVHGERTSPPNGHGGEEGRPFLHILTGQAESQQQAQKPIEGRGEGHG